MVVYPQCYELSEVLQNLENVRPLLKRLKNHDKKIHTHSLRVTAYSLDLGYENGLEDSLYDLGVGALLHDYGKINVHRRIIRKKGELTEQELRVMKKHALEGAQLVGFNPIIRGIIQYHHAFDRRRQKKPREQIPLDLLPHKSLIEIVAAADMYDALISKRSYKRAMPITQVEQILRKQYTGNQRYIDHLLTIYHSK
ncbi:MAG: HD domain-containing phosphohydrolase [Candidatus Woesearchaeota archaeon]|jgi:putative two-component system response regulator